jgi:tetratricopeptide (TPR) repeat protein
MSKERKRIKHLAVDKRRQAQQDGAAASSAGASRPDVQSLDLVKALEQARVAFSSGEWEKVTTYAERLGGPQQVKTAPWPALAAEAHFRQSLVFLKQQRRRAAVAELEKAVAWQPADGVYLYHLGLAYHRLHRWAEAMDAYNRAWQAWPSWRVAYHQALAAVQAGNTFAAEWPELERRLTETATSSQERAAIARLIAWRAAAADEPFWKGVRRLPPVIHLEAALFLTAAGDFKAAEAARSKAVARAGIGDAAMELTTDQQLVALALRPLLWQSDRALRSKLLGLDLGLRGFPLDRPATDSDAASLAKARQLLDWALWQTGWRYWQKEQEGDALYLWQLACKYGVGTLAHYHNCALAAERVAQWDDVVEAWEAYARRLSSAAADGPGERAWYEQLRLQVYIHLIQLARKRKELPIYDWLQAALKSPALDAETRLLLAEMAGSSGISAVRAVLRPLHSQAAGDVELARKLAEMYEHYELGTEARMVWELVLAADPGDVRAQQSLSQMLCAEAHKHLLDGKKGRLSTAGERLERAAKLHPDNPEVWALKAAYHLKCREAAAAAQCVERMLERDNSVNALIELVKLLLTVGLPDEARHYLNLALQRECAPQVRAFFGLSLVEGGDVDQGVAQLLRACREGQFDPEFCTWLLAELFEMGAHSAVVELATLFEKQRKVTAEMLSIKLFCLLQLRDIDKALSYLDKALALARKERNRFLVENLSELRKSLKMMRDIASTFGTDSETFRALIDEVFDFDGRRSGKRQRRR